MNDFNELYDELTGAYAQNEALMKRIRELDERLKLYQTAINKIDDYFEYMFESAEDRDAVEKILDNLAKGLAHETV